MCYLKTDNFWHFIFPFRVSLRHEMCNFCKNALLDLHTKSERKSHTAWCQNLSAVCWVATTCNIKPIQRVCGLKSITTAIGTICLNNWILIPPPSPFLSPSLFECMFSQILYLLLLYTKLLPGDSNVHTKYMCFNIEANWKTCTKIIACITEMGFHITI